MTGTDGFTCWAEEFADHVERAAENPREYLEAEDEASRYYDLEPFAVTAHYGEPGRPNPR